MFLTCSILDFESSDLNETLLNNVTNAVREEHEQQGIYEEEFHKITVIETVKSLLTVKHMEHTLMLPEYPKSDNEGFGYCVNMNGLSLPPPKSIPAELGVSNKRKHLETYS
jgi:hypothetical protein